MRLDRRCDISGTFVGIYSDDDDYNTNDSDNVRNMFVAVIMSVVWHYGKLVLRVLIILSMVRLESRLETL